MGIPKRTCKVASAIRDQNSKVFQQMRHRALPLPPTGLLLAGGYLVLWLLLWLTIQPYWTLAYGLRFGALLLAPPRYWGWLIGAELLGVLGVHVLEIDMLGGHALGMETATHSALHIASVLSHALPELLTMVIGVGVLRRLHLRASLHSPQEAIRLLLSFAAIVICTALVEAMQLTFSQAFAGPTGMLRIIGERLLSHYLSLLLIVPLMILVVRVRFEPQSLPRLVRDGLLVMLPSMVILLLLSQHAPPQPQFARVLSLAPVLFFAFRHGWRGASLAMLIASLGMTLVDQQLGHAPSTAAAYLFLAVAGTGALLLGSATDALRRSNEHAAEQNAHLGAVNQRLDELAEQLRSAARGNLRTDENQRRYLAAELHDELGQNITAIQTHVKLAQTRLRHAGMQDISESINAILAHMRRALHRMLDDLRPAVLDEFGLMRALDEGPIRDLLRAANLAYSTRLHGDPRLLDDDTRTTLYRLAQEAATNTVKHAGATEFCLRLRIGVRHGHALAILVLQDDGIGLPDPMPRGGRGMQGMRDRVTSLGGQLRSSSGPRGTRLRILLRSSTPLSQGSIRPRNFSDA